MSTQPGFELDSSLRAQIEQLAAESHMTPQAVLRDAVAFYANLTKDREAAYRDAEAAWQDYQATGLHLTGEEVDEWLAKIEAGENPPMPPCHT